MGGATKCTNLCSKRNPNGDKNGEQVTTKDFIFHHAIGRGAFGKVMKVEKDGKYYALKEML